MVFNNKKLISSLLLTVLGISLSACQRGIDPNTVLPSAQVSNIETFDSEIAGTIDGEFLIKRKGTTYLSENSDFMSKFNVDIVDSIPELGIEVVKLPQNGYAKALGELQNDPGIQFIEPNYIRKMRVIANNQDSMIGSSSIERVGLSRAANIDKGRSYITIGVIGTGVDSSHPQFQGKLVTGFSIYGDKPDDINGSGTHQAGVIIAQNNSSQGVASNSKVMPVKVMNEKGETRDSYIIKGTAWAISHGSKVVTLTAEGDKNSKALEELSKYAFEKNVPIVVGSGDRGLDKPSFPAATKGMIAVSSTNDSDSLSTFSNFGKWISVSAPGTIESTTPSKSVYLNTKGMSPNSSTMSGSYVSAAYVAGQLALLKSRFPKIDLISLKKHLELTSDDLGTKGPDSRFGFGRINIARSLMVVPPNSNTKR